MRIGPPPPAAESTTGIDDEIARVGTAFSRLPPELGAAVVRGIAELGVALRELREKFTLEAARADAAHLLDLLRARREARDQGLTAIAEQISADIEYALRFDRESTPPDNAPDERPS